MLESRHGTPAEPVGTGEKRRAWYGASALTTPLIQLYVGLLRPPAVRQRG